MATLIASARANSRTSLLDLKKETFSAIMLRFLFSL